MTRELKVGDKIRNVSDNDPEIPVGYEAVIYRAGTDRIHFEDQKGYARERPSVNYELITEVPAQPVFDATKLRKGDKVLIICAVEGDGLDEDNELFVGLAYAKPSQIVGYAPGYVPAPIEEPLKIGDKVTADVWADAGALRIEKISEDGNTALLYLYYMPESPEFYTCPIGELKRASR